ncbi:patatin-like phospholipase domain-containing protein 2 [Stegastes partitus]|uniref:Patatin-like phospholipase domain-containing protein 2 n=1 Tax=Stegastes partitus TaxID=144197 RepID=A0A9Y4K7H0_9TELE|nr:PREDICTED: patatin-like phospholipase domain-containing protein 2 [Stegastes partitus]
MAPGVSSCHYREVPRSISFSGSGFLATYQLGVIQCFLNHAPWILRTAPSVLGASAGSLVAAAVVCEMNPTSIKDEIIHFAKQMKAFTLGPLNPSVNVFRWLEDVLRKHLPDDAHQLASGRLAVATTRLTDGKHTVMTEFHSREDVVQALLCSCYVPGYCGFLPPSFKGVRYLDGGFTGMQPISSSSTLTVCPFSGETDICPADTPCMWEMVTSGAVLNGNLANSLRIVNALYPMTMEVLEQAFHDGYKDAVHFLLSNVSPGPLSYEHTNEWMHLETTKEREEETKVEKEVTPPTTSTANRSKQMSNSKEQEIARYPSLHLDMTKNVLLANSVTYLSMLGLPARILSYLLLPLTLLFSVILQSRHRLGLLFRQEPELIGWTWHSMRLFTLFFVTVCICTIKKNIQGRVMPIILMLQWLSIQGHYEAERGLKYSSLQNKLSSHSEDERSSSLQRLINSLSPGYKNQRLQ